MKDGGNPQTAPVGLHVEARFHVRPDAKIEWVLRHVVIRDGSGVVFSQPDVEAPRSWSDRALEQPARLYFRVRDGRREGSVGQIVDRVVCAIVDFAQQSTFGTLLVSGENAERLREELRTLSLTQRFAWNTPVWVNVGATPRPQSSACFLLSVEDTLESITNLQQTEVEIFRHGGGAGSNLSSLRPRNASLSHGGTASGPVSFMLGFDAWAGVTRSGGKARRAAKMVVLNVDHPDIFDFVDTKPSAQRMIKTLTDAGYNPDFNAQATAWARYQNANHSVRVTDAFMEAVERVTASGTDEPWTLRWAGSAADVIERETTVRTLWQAIVSAAYACGDPGLQFDDVINRMNTCPALGRINTSNPCSEVLFPDDVACNLGSHRLRKYWDAERRLFLIEDFRAATRLGILSMEALVSGSSYPTEAIANNSRDYRILGIGYADLGALLMECGRPYDSDRGRFAAAAITALLAAEAYRTSAEIAQDCGGPFPGFDANREAMLRVVAAQGEAARHLCVTGNEDDPFTAVALAAYQTWVGAIELGSEFGFRNAQVVVLAPTGTIGFMMDCDTTGVEPDTGLVKRKRLASGGELRIVNQAVGPALRALGYPDAEIAAQLDLLEREERLDLPPDDMKVFECAFGDNRLRPEAHVLMVGAVQPFLSGGCSKTVNLPATATVEDVDRIYRLAWRCGLKSVSIYIDGSKGSQPITVGKAPPLATAPLLWGARRHLPSRVPSVRKKFTLEGVDFYFHVGWWPEDGRPAEVWIAGGAKEGSFVHETLGLLATQISVSLQSGTPFRKVVEKLEGRLFAPAGFTGDPEFPAAKSFGDAFAQWVRKEFPNEFSQVMETLAGTGEMIAAGGAPHDFSGPLCPHGCGPMRQDGTCWRCEVCGDSTGGCGG